MSRFLCWVLSVAFCVFPAKPAFADEGVRMGMAGEVLVPLEGSFQEFYNTGFGVSLRGQYAPNDLFALMITAGYLTFPPDAPSGVTVENAVMVPVVAGAKLMILPGEFRIYGALDLGITAVQQSKRTSQGGNSDLISSVEFTWQPQVGFEADIGKNTSMEISGRFVALSGAESIGIRAGILFGL